MWSVKRGAVTGGIATHYVVDGACADRIHQVDGKLDEERAQQNGNHVCSCASSKGGRFVVCTQLKLELSKTHAIAE